MVIKSTLTYLALFLYLNSLQALPLALALLGCPLAQFHFLYVFAHVPDNSALALVLRGLLTLFVTKSWAEGKKMGKKWGQAEEEVVPDKGRLGVVG